MKRYCAFLLLFIALVSSLTPLFGVQSAQAQQPRKPPLATDFQEMSDIFKDRQNESNGGDFWLGKESGSITDTAVYKTTAKLSARLAISDIYSAAEDDNKNGYVDSGDYLGGWLSILDRELITFPSVDQEHGIFLELLEVPKGEVKTEEELELNKYKYLAKQGGPYYSTSRLKIPFGADQLDRTKFEYGGQVSTLSAWNIGLFFWAIDPQTNFFGKKSISANIVLTDLKPDTKYYYRLVLHEDAPALEKDGTATTQFTEESSFETDSTKADPSPEELQSVNGTSNGSSTDGNVAADIFGDRVECTLHPSTWFGCFAIGYYNTIYYITGWLLRGAAGLMDIFMAYSLSSFIYQNSFINTGWSVVRDVCNILFIFILLWTAFKLVINDHGYHAKETIVNIVIIGLLLNFSLFFSKVLIDVGNISARVFYNQIRITGSAQGDQDEVAQAINTGDLKPKAISEAIANGLDVTAIGNKGFQKLSEENNGFIPLGTVWLLLLLGTTINIFAAWIFVKVSFAFLGRILSLWMGMIFSPFAFTSTIIAGGGHGHGGPLEGVQKIGWRDWLKNMLEASFYPALFLFFVFLIIILINDNFLASMIDDTKLSPTPYLIVTLFKFIFILGLLKASSDFAKKMSGMFGGEVTAMAGKAAAFVGGAAIGIATGGAALAGSRLIGGRAAATLAGTEGDALKRFSTGDFKGARNLFKTDDEYNAFMNKHKLSDTEAGRARAQSKVESLQKTASRSFDLRNTRTGNILSSATGLNFNAAASIPGMGSLDTSRTAGGQQAYLDRRTAKDAKYFQSIGASKEDIERAKGNLEEAKEDLKEKEKADRKEIERLERENADYAQRKQAGDTNNYSSAVATNQASIKAIKDRLDSAHEDAKAKNPDGSFRDIPNPGAGATPEEKRKYDIAVAKRAEMEAEAKLKESQKSGLRQYQEYLKRNHYDHGGRTGSGFNGFGLRKMLKGDFKGMASDFAKDIATAFQGAWKGALVGSIIPGVGTITGAIAGAVGGGILSTLKKHTFDINIQNKIDHAIAAGHIHEPHAKSKYKTPNGSWFEKMFKGDFGGGGGGHGGGHDDHGGGHGHDDHGGGHH